MPIATPEVYAEMLDRAKAGRSPTPRSTYVVADPERRASAASPRPRATASCRSPPAAPSTSRARRVKDMVTGAAGARGVRARGREEVPRQHRAAHRPLPQGQARRLRPPAARDQSTERVAPRRGAAVPVAHVGRLGRAAGREPARSPASCSSRPRPRKIVLEIEIGVVGGEEDGVANEINEKLYTTPGGRAGRRPRRWGSARTAATCRADLRQRARRLQAGQRQAAPRDPQGDPGRGRRRSTARRSRSTSSSTAAPARCSRRSRPRSTTAWSR